MSQPGQIERVVEALESARVDYIIVGGVAVVLHGHLRVTADLDLVIRLEEDNAKAAVDALQGIGFAPRAPVPASWFAERAKREEWASTKNMMVFSLWSPHSDLEVDLFVREPFDFRDVASRCVRVELGGSKATVIGLNDLLALKRAAGRTQDLADIEALELLTEGR